MPSHFQEEIKRKRRDLILLASIDVIAEHGFARASIQQIAEHAGVSTGTIYNYFENKEAMLDAILMQSTDAEKHDLVVAEIENVDFDAFIRDYVSHRMAEIEDGFKALKIVLIEVLTNPEYRESTEQSAYLPLFAILETYVERQLTDEKSPDKVTPAVAARLFASPIMGLLLMRLLGDTHIEKYWDDYISAVTDHLIRAYR